ncbi:hypothetical protein [Priestia aryabhattai]|uniref:hypothetical protein n=1 Tax=Priestia aryabhattai TaxID=412384 RepID=UPI0023B0BE1E|nr:hypothetical protein [Priestia aryabhattai]MDE8674689.1 hypothetical protein [Priestia aryabhattai]
MSDKSPLFVSSLELLAHGTELYSNGHKRKYKFVILHLANSIELLVKDLLIDKGISIYKNRSTDTISIWSAFEELNNLGISIIERPVIELLIDDRNTIQHRFGFPDAESVYYYLENVVKFFNRILDEHYAVKLTEALEPHLSKENLQLLGLVEEEFEFLDKLFSLSPESAIMHAHSQIENEFLRLIPDSRLRKQPLFKQPQFLALLSKLENGSYITNAIDKYNLVRNSRNTIAHSAVSHNDVSELREPLETAREILSALKRAEEDEYFTQEDIGD